MKILSLALILLIAGRSNSSEKFEPSQIEAELAMKMLFVMLNIVSAEMSTMTGSPKQQAYRTKKEPRIAVSLMLRGFKRGQRL